MPVQQTFKKIKIPLKDRLADDWADGVAAFENDLYRCNRSHATVTTYRSCLNAFAEFYRHDLQKPGPYIARLQETDLKAFVDHLRYDRKLSATSVNRYVAALRAFSRFILVDGRHRAMVAQHLRTYRVDTGKNAALSSQELRRLITAVDLNGRNGRRDFAVLQLFLQCGLRVSEVVRLSRDDVIVHKTVGHILVRNEKGRQDRSVPLNLTVRRALLDYLDARGPGSGIEPLFVSERRRRLSIASVQYMIKKYLSIAGRDDLSAQDLRRHFAQAFYERSGNLTATQKVLGHRDINTTARYTQPSDRQIQATIDALDRPT
ncbi:tyrosine recombinase XerC (plasmid) [Desulfosarcina ovata subsp. sediminis]|uniref:Tyrosine recombinase XerC n=1 Tax=Desulfosarcina ovata subsp. sediminis TaxID=885957 RepID=A0A5K8A2V8_9BACT|nr:tyrosine-type recombinase/integrase [Desulfosarcina ovata]BBO86684.1 tyrosine recombinase XerC [Desulfosarcina ovata subsp. sediminis]